jgi:SAM-dependent methyltransferase
VSESLIYRSPLLYRAAMLALYGRHYFSRCRAMANLIPVGASVLELCCGPADLYLHYLKTKNVRYLGLDINPRFIARLGEAGRVWNVQEPLPLPGSDYVLMQASLYHFLPDPAPVIDRMLSAAARQVIVAEPIRNLSDGRVPFLSALARRGTDAGTGAQPRRFNEQTLDAFFSRYAGRVSRSFLIPGGREKVYLLDV